MAFLDCNQGFGSSELRGETLSNAHPLSQKLHKVFAGRFYNSQFSECLPILVQEQAGQYSIIAVDKAVYYFMEQGDYAHIQDLLSENGVFIIPVANEAYAKEQEQRMNGFFKGYSHLSVTLSQLIDGNHTLAPDVASLIRDSLMFRNFRDGECLAPDFVTLVLTKPTTQR